MIPTEMMVMKNSMATLKNSLVVSYKAKHGTNIFSNNHGLLGIYLRELKTLCSHKNLNINVYSNLFCNNLNWKQLKSLSTSEWLNSDISIVRNTTGQQKRRNYQPYNILDENLCWVKKSFLKVYIPYNSTHIIFLQYKNYKNGGLIIDCQKLKKDWRQEERV